MYAPAVAADAVAVVAVAALVILAWHTDLEREWKEAGPVGVNEQRFTRQLASRFHMTPERMHVLFQKMDCNGDGSLSWDE